MVYQVSAAEYEEVIYKTRAQNFFVRLIDSLLTFPVKLESLK